MPKSRDAMGKDNDMNHERPEPQSPQLGATHEANVRGEFRIAPNVPPEHRIPQDKLPEALRKRFPEGMPIQSGRASDLDNDALLQVLKKLIEKGDLERVMQVLAEKAGKEPGKDMEAFAEMFGAQRDIFRKRYLELQRPDLTAEQRAELLKIPAQMVGEVATTNNKGEPLPPFDREKMKTEKEMKLMVTLYKIQIEMQLAMAAFGSGLNYEDQTFFRVGQMNPEGSAQHDIPIYKLFQFVSAAAPAEANLDAEQFAQLAAADRREAFAGTQARFYIWVRGESGTEYQDYVPLSAFMDKVDAPEWSRKLLVQPWADERVVPRPGEEPGDEMKKEGWTKPTYVEGYVESIVQLINEVLEEKLKIPPGEKILSTNLWHPLMSTRIDAERLRRDDVRVEVISNLFSHFLASFTLLRMFGRDRAWDKTLSGRVIDAFRKGLSPQVYYEQLYGLPPEGRGPIFLLTMYWDIWGEKLDKFFPWDRINFNAAGETRTLETVKQEITSANIRWYEGWDRFDSVAGIQRKIVETKLRREGVAASEVWRESLMVMGLATRDAKAAVATYEEMLKKDKLDPAKRKTLVSRFSQYVSKLNETNPYGFEVYHKMAGIGATDTGYRAWIGEKMTEAIYSPRIAMARPGEMRSPAEMGDFYWTRAEEIVLRDADFEGVFHQWSKPEYQKAWIDQKKAADKDAFKGRRGAQRVLEYMSYDNIDPQKLKDSDPKKWHDYINNAAKTSNSMIGVTEVAVAKESIRDILEKGVAQGQFLNDEAVRDAFDRYFVNQFKEAFGEMKKTFNYFPREFKAHVGKEIILCLARLACKLKDNQWYTMMHRSSSGDGAGWGEVNLDQRFFLNDQGELNEDGKLLQRLGLQFQGKSVYQRNGYPVSWQVQPSHMAILAGVEKVNFLTPMQAQYGGRVIGREVFMKLVRDVIGDFLFADAIDVQSLLAELEEITDKNSAFKYTEMTPVEIEMMKNAAAQYAPIFTGVGKFIQGRK